MRACLSAPLSKPVVHESMTLQHCCWPTATGFTQWMNEAETWVDETGRMLLHTVCLTLSVFLSTPGLRAGAPRQDKRNEKTQRSAEEKLLGARKCQRQSSYLDYRSHNPSLSLESTYSPSRTPYPRIPFWPRVHYPNFVQYTQAERSISPRSHNKSKSAKFIRDAI